MFFSFDGIDGVGKSTQVRLFCDALARADTTSSFAATRAARRWASDPRVLLLERCSHADRPPQRDAALHGGPGAAGGRSDPARRSTAGKIVVSDRYLARERRLSGPRGRARSRNDLAVGRVATDGFSPIACSCSICRRRPRTAGWNGAGSHGKPRRRVPPAAAATGFLHEAAKSQSRIHVIDAGQPIEAVQADIWQIAGEIAAESDTNVRFRLVFHRPSAGSRSTAAQCCPVSATAQRCSGLVATPSTNIDGIFRAD